MAPHLSASVRVTVQDFYEDIFEELAKYGEVENLNICDNLADHMVGSVYAKFRDEDAAARALQVPQAVAVQRLGVSLYYSFVGFLWCSNVSLQA